MKIRDGFVSNSSSSSFLVFARDIIKEPQPVLDYIESHESCVGMVKLHDLYGSYVSYFDIEGVLRRAILEHREDLEETPSVVVDFRDLGHAKDRLAVINIDESMVKGNIYLHELYNNYETDRRNYIPIEDFWWDGSCVVEALFGDRAKEINEEYNLVEGLSVGYFWY